MTKGRGSNERRRNQRLAGRKGGGTQSGMTMAQVRANRQPAIKVPWYRRMWESVKRGARDVEATVAPKRAMRRLENEYRRAYVEAIQRARSSHAPQIRRQQRR